MRQDINRTTGRSMGRGLVTVLIGAVLSTACHRAPQIPADAPRPRVAKMGKVVIQGNVAARMVMATWTRPGHWIALTAQTPLGEVPVSSSSDTYGTRLVTTSGSIGYTITQAIANCRRHTVRLIESATAKDDAGDPDIARKGRPVAMFLPPSEITRLCNAPTGDRATSRPIKTAIEQLRKVVADKKQSVTSHQPTYARIEIPNRAKMQAEADKAQAEAQRTGRETVYTHDFPGMPGKPAPR